MKILFVGVFTKGSTNISQRDCLRKLGHEVDEFSYRLINNFNIVLQEIKDYDIVLISKGNGISQYTMKQLKKNNKKIVYWFMDPRLTYTSEMAMKTQFSDTAYFDKIKTLNVAKRFNSKSKYVCEGYDESIDCLQNVEKEYDVSFIGNVYGNRKSMLKRLSGVEIITSAYGLEHSIEVGKSKINLNICTDNCASDRVYKVLAAGGFLLSDEWEGREMTGLIDGEDLVIYKDVDDLQDKILYYLKEENLRNKISNSGMNKVKKLTRMEWANAILG